MASACALRVSPVCAAVARPSGAISGNRQLQPRQPASALSHVFHRSDPVGSRRAFSIISSAAGWLEPFDFEHSRRTSPAALTRQSMLAPAADMVDLTSRLFDEFANITNANKMVPHTGFLADVAETDAEYTLTGELPGMGEENVDIRLDGRNLVISAEVKHETKEESPDGVEGSKPRMVRVERHQRSFQRVFHLPKNVNAEEITASMDKGILSVRLPKQEDDKATARHIPIGKPAERKAIKENAT